MAGDALSEREWGSERVGVKRVGVKRVGVIKRVGVRSFF